MKVKPFDNCLFFNPAKMFLNSVLRFVSEISATVCRTPVLAAVAPTVVEGVDMSSKRIAWLLSTSSLHMPCSLLVEVFNKPSENCNNRPARYNSKETENENFWVPHHNRFTALFVGPPGWAGARRELLDFMVQKKINRGRHTDHPAGRNSIRTNQFPPPPSPIFLKAGCPSCHPTNSVKALKATSAFGLQRGR